jgi:hypothetical protein
MGPDDVRSIALALHSADEAGHHGRPSFRVHGRIFATLWTPSKLNVMLDQGEIEAAVQASPGACSAFLWGGVPRAVQIDLSAAAPDLVRSLLEEAWARAAPRAVRRAAEFGSEGM